MELAEISSNDDSISVKVYAKSKKNIDLYKDEDNNIVINQEKRKGSICVGFCFGNYNVIKIYLPKDYDGKFNIKSKSGDITSDIDNYLAFNVKLTSGDIDIKNIKSLVGRTTSGDIEIKDLSSYIDFKTTSGDIEIDNFDIQRGIGIGCMDIPCYPLGRVRIFSCQNSPTAVHMRNSFSNIHHGRHRLQRYTTYILVQASCQPRMYEERRLSIRRYRKQYRIGSHDCWGLPPW